jgi:type 1 glutamine amidotransferase
MKRFLLLLFVVFSVSSALAGDQKMIVMIAGKPSHGPGQHEHNAGILLLKKCLEEGAGDQVTIRHHLNAEWPSAEELAAADTVVIYADGGGGHPALQGNRLAQLDKEMQRGCGFLTIHYAVEPTLAKGNREFLAWMGGCFEINWSVNPHWEANFKELPAHPISQGVKPFGTNDEWYFHMRFRPEMEGVTPILSDVAPESTMKRPDGSHSGNPAVRASVARGDKQHVAWASERVDGGRGFGFTGGHFHRGWGNDEQRKLVLNAILWTAHGEIPAAGVPSVVTEEDLKANLDLKPGQGLPEKAKAAK